MFKSLVKRLVLGGAVAVSLAAALPAQAAVYTGNWDPAFGAAYSQLGWKGEASFYIPDACLALGAGTYFNASGCSQGAMQLLSASVSLYQLGNEANILETIDFSAPSSSFATLAMSVDANHQLDGVFGLFDYFVPANVNLAIAGGIGAQYGLAFVDNIAVLGIRSSSGVLSFSQLIAPDGGKPLISFTPAIPEPETYALMLAGLGMVLVLSSRRRR
jgi:hypothetical protein